MTISGAQFVAEVEKFKGFPYIFGDAGPNAFDCSGLVKYALTQLGVKDVPRTSEEQYAWADKISKDQLQPGDLVFAQFAADSGSASPGHVGVYVGNGEILSAEDPAQGVGLASLSSWGSNIVGYGRVPDSAGGSATDTASLASGVFSWPTDITGFFGDAKTGLDALMWLVNPASWVRIGSFFLGTILVIAAIYIFIRVGSDEPVVPRVVPVPV
jgi:cell wall-associated NlpC family hydrolase